MSLVAAVLVLTVAAYVGFQAWSFNSGLKRSSALDGVSGSGVPAAAGPGPGPALRPGSVAGGPPGKPDTNILVMGLDSRLDENGNPLPPQLYEALHAGDQSDGGLNANVLMFFHIPGDGSRATEISIPRDDNVELVGCPAGVCEGKIKQAYGLAFDQESRRLTKEGGHSKEEAQQLARDAGRRTQVATVQKFLGDVPVDHFVEITMAAFYQIAEVVQPITVCVKQDTQDSYSGANFRAGQQQVSAAQAVAFVRQRRDNVHPELLFTDLDRERRQQAFVTSLLSQLRQAQTFTNPGKIQQILDVAKQNTAIDSRLDLLSFLGEAKSLAGGNITFYALPVERFGKNSRGEDVNYVNLPQIRMTVKALLSGQPVPGSAPPAGPGGAASPPVPGPTPSPTSAPAPTPGQVPVPVPADGGEQAGPAPTDLSALTGGGVPCVK